MFVVESPEYIGDVSQIPMRLPCRFVISGPLHEVFNSSVPSSRVKDVLDFVFFFVVDDYRRRIWLLLALEGIIAGGFEERDMEDWVDFHLGR